MDKFFTWDSLKTIAGISTATGLATQIIKDWFPIPTQILAYIVSTLILISIEICKTRNIKNIPLCFINGFVSSSLASNTVSLANRLM